MDQLERLTTLINVADDILDRRRDGDENVDEAALVVALLIERELRQVED